MAMKLCFIGSSAFGLRCLQLLERLSSVQVVGAVTAPRTFAISYRPQGVTNVLHADVQNHCKRHAIPCAMVSTGMRDPTLLATVREWRPDLFVVAGWYHMVPRSWRDVAPAYGLHASLLPDYSGGAPLVWAMINGETRTGITLFQLGDGVDDGPILGQAATDILVTDTIATLYARIEELGLQLIETHVPSLAAGTAVLRAQDDRARRVFPQRGPEDGVIDWRQPSCRVHNFVRAQSKPYPGAFTLIDGDKLTIWASKDVGTAASALNVGEVRMVDGNLLAGCAEGTVLKIENVAVNGKDMSPQEWWRSRASAVR